jgi:D-sedoheptulose 7-phosphate isomerase
MSYKIIKEASRALINKLENIKSYEIKNLIKIKNIIKKNIQSKNKIMMCGNGGSSAQASHFSTELVVRFKKKFERKAYNSICLSSDPSLLTAIGNDYGFEKIFSRQIEGIGTNQDLLIIFTTSGNSKNLIEAIKTANKKKVKIVSFTGNDGGKVKKMTKLNYNINSTDTARIQECHLFLIHLIIEIIEIENKEKI